MHAVYFVAGTDTGAGKTFCTAALLHALRRSGRRAAGFKPVASEADARGQNADVLALQAASEPMLAYADHNVYTFAEATAPHLAAHDEGRAIEPARLSAGLAQAQGEAVVMMDADGQHPVRRASGPGHDRAAGDAVLRLCQQLHLCAGRLAAARLAGAGRPAAVVQPRDGGGAGGDVGMDGVERSDRAAA